MIKHILFDLDGTLLKMDNKAFIDYYFQLLGKKMATYGYDVKELVKAIWMATMEVLKNDGTMTNRERFFLVFCKDMEGKLHAPKEEVERVFNEFYDNEFDEAKVMVKRDGESGRIVQKLKEEGYDLIVATSPVFPRVAVEKRLSWIGLKSEDFSLVTTYENSTFCKPDPAYYKEILMKLNLRPDECLMVGNDLKDDLYPALSQGIKGFYLNTYPINDDDQYDGPKGDFSDLLEYLEKEKI